MIATRYDRHVASSVIPVSTSEAVGRILRDRILGGEYAPADRLPPQRELAALLGVSRVSVRQGLRLLIEDGYVEVKRGSRGGAFVTEMSQPAEARRRRLRSHRGELDDLVEFRIAVESRVAHLAALRSTRSDLAQMRSAIRDMGAIAEEAGDHRRFRTTDAEFHAALGRAARNDRLNRAVADTRNEMFPPYDTLPFAEPTAAVVADHQAIYEAIRDGLAGVASDLMGEHIRRTRDQLLSYVAEDCVEN